MDNQRRFDLGSWLVLALAIVTLAAPIAQLLWSFDQPSDGWLWDDTGDRYIAVERQTSGSSPLRADDELVAIEGQSITSGYVEPPLPPPSGWKLGGIAHYTVERAGQVIALDVPLVRRELSWVLRYLVTNRTDTAVFSAALNLALAATVFALRPGATAARLLLLIFAFFSGTSFAFADTNPALRFAPPAIYYAIRAQGQLWPLWFALMLHLVLAFPVRTWPLQRWPRVSLALIYGIASLGMLDLIGLGPGALLLFTYMMLVLVALVAATTHHLRVVGDPAARAQVGWFCLGLAVSFGSMILILGVGVLLYDSLTFPFYWLWSVTLLPALPLCLGIAITRYRLFDIEIIIRRTLVYSALTAVLALVYVGCIVVSRRLVAPLVGSSEAAIVASTLAIAALFFPLRRRIQSLIDRRFYRRKYDAAKVLAAFGAAARDETNLDALTGELLRAVDETMQPEFVGLWLREAGQPQGTTSRDIRTQ